MDQRIIDTLTKHHPYDWSGGMFGCSCSRWSPSTDDFDIAGREHAEHVLSELRKVSTVQ